MFCGDTENNIDHQVLFCRNTHVEANTLNIISTIIRDISENWINSTKRSKFKNIPSKYFFLRIYHRKIICYENIALHPLRSLSPVSCLLLSTLLCLYCRPNSSNNCWPGQTPAQKNTCKEADRGGRAGW